jgi:hypothetical protein
MIEEYDVPILKHLTDVKLEYIENGFNIHFYFSANEFFTNEVLTKHYESEVEADEDAVFFEGSNYVAAEGTTIAWKQGKDVTVKMVKKKQKKKGKPGKPAEVRTIVSAEPQPSFFNYFASAEAIEDDEDDEEAQMRIEGRMMLDFEVRLLFKWWWRQWFWRLTLMMACLFFPCSSPTSSRRSLCPTPCSGSRAKPWITRSRTRTVRKQMIFFIII